MGDPDPGLDDRFRARCRNRNNENVEDAAINPLLNEIRRNPLLWLLTFVPVHQKLSGYVQYGCMNNIFEVVQHEASDRAHLVVPRNRDAA